ncbi:MAG: winged helix-turn-helix transcriptional regulator [Armatimonadetes bacterium]|nr:winged helix-turn-helix transcriptional regulator [Armatimonadota bacterium]
MRLRARGTLGGTGETSDWQNRGSARMRDAGWTLLTTHGQALFYVAAHPDASIPTIAAALGLSERRIGSVLRDLRGEGMVRVTRVGRRNVYEVNGAVRFRHPILAHVRLGEILDTFAPHGPKLFYAPENTPPDTVADG